MQRNSPLVQWLGLSTFSGWTMVTGSIPGWGTRILQAIKSRPKNNNKKAQMRVSTMVNCWGPLFPYPLPSSHIWDAFSHHLGFSHQNWSLGCGFSGQKARPWCAGSVGISRTRAQFPCVRKGEKGWESMLESWTRGRDLVDSESCWERAVVRRGRWSICQNQATNSHRGWACPSRGNMGKLRGDVSPSILISARHAYTTRGLPFGDHSVCKELLSCQLISKTSSAAIKPFIPQLERF